MSDDETVGKRTDKAATSIRDISANETVVRRPESGGKAERDISGDDTAVHKPSDVVVKETSLFERVRPWVFGIAGLAAMVMGIHQIYTSFDNQPSAPPVTQQTQAPGASESQSGTAARQPNTAATQPKTAARQPSTSASQPSTATQTPQQISVNYRTYRNARFGFSFEYPTDLVNPGPVPQNGAGLAFSAPDGSFRISSQGFFSPDKTDARSKLKELTDGQPQFQNATIVSVVPGSLSAIATNGGRVASMTLILTCNNGIVNSLQLNFLQRPDYDAIALHMVQTFKSGKGEDILQSCDRADAAPGAATTAGNSADTVIANAFNGDASLRRLAVYGWSGFRQGTFWAGSGVGHNGSALKIRCSAGPSRQRSGSIDWTDLPTGNRPLAGVHNVVFQVGTFTSNINLNFSQSQTTASGVASINENAQSAGRFLEFLENMSGGQSVAVRIPDRGYQERFSLHSFGQAMGPCFGQPVALPWTAQEKRDGVYSVETRNTSGAGVLLRCDSTSDVRGNTAMAFAVPGGRNANLGDQITLNASVAGRSLNINFIVNEVGGALGGYFYQVAAQTGTRNLSDFLALLRAGNTLTLANGQLGINQVFSLNGSSQALAGCASTY